MGELFSVIEIIGLVSFAISGAMIAIDSDADIFGVVFLSLMTVFGGGIMRDIILDNTPLFFTSYVEVCIALAIAILTFVVAYIYRKGFKENEPRVKTVNNVFDAIGLGVYAVYGVQVCLEAGQSGAFICIIMGLITAVGGGLTRDLIIGDLPLILRKRVYALAAIAGSLIYYLLNLLCVYPPLGMLIGVGVTFIIRILATYFKWNLPKINFDTEDKNT